MAADKSGRMHAFVDNIPNSIKHYVIVGSSSLNSAFRFMSYENDSDGMN